MLQIRHWFRLLVSYWRNSECWVSEERVSVIKFLPKVRKLSFRHIPRNHRGWDFHPEVGLVLTGGHSCEGTCKFIKNAQRTQDYGASFTQLASLQQPVNQGGHSINSRKISRKISQSFFPKCFCPKMSQNIGCPLLKSGEIK